MKKLITILTLSISTSCFSASWNEYGNNREQIQNGTLQQNYIEENVPYETFLLDPENNKIQDFVVYGMDNITPGQTIRFVLDAVQNGKAIVKFKTSPNVEREIILNEIDVGQYVGSYTIKPSDNIKKQPFQVFINHRKNISVATYKPSIIIQHQSNIQQNLNNYNPNFGVVTNIEAIQVSKNSPNLAGTAIGGGLGGLTGNQFGQGSGKDALTIVGVAIGAFLGNQVEDKMNQNIKYKVTVQFEDGSSQQYIYSRIPQLTTGTSVYREGSNLFIR